MWGTSSPGDKLTGDFGNEPDATSISDRGLFRLLAGNLSPGVFRLLQHNLPISDIPANALHRPRSGLTPKVLAHSSFPAIQNIATIQFSSGFIWGIPAINN